MSDARREYQRDYWRGRARVLGHRPHVDAAPVAAHLEWLRACGVTMTHVVATSGVAQSTLRLILGGQVSSVRAGTAERILAVTLGYTPTGLTRRMRALATLGWSCRQVADVANVHPQVVGDTQRAEFMYSKCGEALDTAYRALSLRTPPQHTRYERSAVTAIRNRAKAAGWAPPLAWDDDIDNPAATPDLGAKPRQGADLDEFLFLVGAGELPAQAASRLGVNLNSIERAAGRHQRRDVLDALALYGREAAA